MKMKLALFALSVAPIFAQSSAQLPGSYRPRIYGAFRQDVYLRTFDPHPRSVAVQIPLLEETSATW